MRKLMILMLVALLPCIPACPAANAEPVYQGVEQTSTTLGISGVYTSSAFAVWDYETVGVVVSSDVSSATDGLKIQFSNNEDCETVPPVSWDYTANTNGWTYTTGSTQAFAASVMGKCARVTYTNGGAAQTSFKLSTFLLK